MTELERLEARVTGLEVNKALNKLQRTAPTPRPAAAPEQRSIPAPESRTLETRGGRHFIGGRELPKDRASWPEWARSIVELEEAVDKRRQAKNGILISAPCQGFVELS